MMNMRLAGKPSAQTMLGASYNERHLSKTEEGLRTLFLYFIQLQLLKSSDRQQQYCEF